jgi:choline-sulfatase
VVETPVSLVDLAPTFMEALGAEPLAADLPGRSLFAIADEPDDPERPVFSEYHAVGAISGMLMLRKGKWKLVHYPGYASQLFDLEADPDEAHDKAADPAFADVLAKLEAELRKICDPEAVNARAFADQAARIEAHGGAEAIIARGDFGYTPAPGQTPVFG